MKIQVVATISIDGYLLKLDNNDKNSIYTCNHGIKALQKDADLILLKESSLIALLEEKRQSSGTNYLAKATYETLSFIKGLFLYQLADELVLYKAPYRAEQGIRLFDLTSPADWVLVKEIFLKNNFHRLVYSRIKS
jgi:hypothetical protein